MGLKVGRVDIGPVGKRVKILNAAGILSRGVSFFTSTGEGSLVEVGAGGTKGR